MFMGGGFCESPFMGLSTITINGEIFYFDFGIDQSLPNVFNITQTYQVSELLITQSPKFDFIIDTTGTFDFNIDELENSNFLR
jgi:hypothetical protein